MLGTAQSAKYSVQSERAASRNVLPTVLLAMVGPVLVFLVIDPRAFSSASVIGHVYLPAIFIISCIAYLISVFETGEVTSITIDKPGRTVAVERTGMLARSVLVLPFAEVATARIESRYDDDGYQTAMPVLVLATREIIPMPAGTTEADVTTIRAMLQPSQ
jgi:hypothetical protein